MESVMARRTAEKTDGRQSESRTPRVMRSLPAEDAINTGAARVGNSSTRGGPQLAMTSSTREASVELLNQLEADTITLRDLYKKHHWQVSGPNFYSLHLLFDKHFNEQLELVDEIGERIRTLGGIGVAMARDVLQLATIPQPPIGRESSTRQIERLLEAHEIILQQSHASARQAAEAGDDGTNDLIVSSVIRTNELQAWFLREHLVDAPSESDSE
jgi:starvation-inducible DNA-binding protein